MCLAEGILANVTVANTHSRSYDSPTIHITSLTQDGACGFGAPVDYYCPQCRRHTFAFSPYLMKPTDGDYFRIQLCPDDDSHNWNWTRISYAAELVQTREMQFLKPGEYPVQS